MGNKKSTNKVTGKTTFKGVPNLVKTGTKKNPKFINQNDVKFSLKEKKHLESLVNSANRKRARMLKSESELIRYMKGESQGDTVGETTGRMGNESDFILKAKSKSLQRFETKKDYNHYIKTLEKIVDRNYIFERVEAYRKNYIKGLKDNLGSITKDLQKKIKNMPIKDYMKQVQSDLNKEIDYIYDANKHDWIVSNILESWGMSKETGKTISAEVYEEIKKKQAKK
jgi:hypothetical protein